MKKYIVSVVWIFVLVAVCNFVSSNTVQADGQLLGGWTAYRALDPQTQRIFDQSVDGLVGVKYTAFCVSSQVVAGTNYCFFCIGTVVNPNAESKNYYLEVFVSLEGKVSKAKITEIEVPHKQLIGSYSIFQPLTAEDKAILVETEPLGYTYIPFCVAKQGSVRSGNPKYFCEGKAVVRDPISQNGFITVYVTDGKPKIAKTVKVAQKELPYILGKPTQKEESK
jgi:hypothetical protein